MRLSASLFAADPLRLFEAVAAVSPYVESLHVDVMDGRFAPAFGFGEGLVRRLLSEGAPPIDVHLMIAAPEVWARRFAMLWCPVAGPGLSVSCRSCRTSTACSS